MLIHPSVEDSHIEADPETRLALQRDHEADKYSRARVVILEVAQARVTRAAHLVRNPLTSRAREASDGVTEPRRQVLHAKILRNLRCVVVRRAKIRRTHERSEADVSAARSSER